MMFNFHKATNIKLRRKNSEVIGTVLEKVAESDLRFNASDTVIKTLRSVKKPTGILTECTVIITVSEALNFKV